MAQIFQFKIILSKSNPPLWRRFQVSSDVNFYEFHNVIQNVMGWSGVCLHTFYFRSENKWLEIKEHNPYPYQAILDEVFLKISEFENTPVIHRSILNELEVKLSDYFQLNDKETEVTYEYDFNIDCMCKWKHELVLETVIDPEEGVLYPVCLDGARACPPEGCGGISQYHKIVKTVNKKTNHFYKRQMEFVRLAPNYKDVEHYDTEKFDPAAIDFSIVYKNPVWELFDVESN